jgi:hypothetical protein
VWVLGKRFSRLKVRGEQRPGHWLATQWQSSGFDRKNNHPRTNFYVSLLQRHRIVADKFASSTGTMHGSERPSERGSLQWPAKKRRPLTGGALVGWLLWEPT